MIRGFYFTTVLVNFLRLFFIDCWFTWKLYADFTHQTRVQLFFISFKANPSEYGSYSLHIRMFRYIRKHRLFASFASYSLQNRRTDSHKYSIWCKTNTCCSEYSLQSEYSLEHFHTGEYLLQNIRLYANFTFKRIFAGKCSHTSEYLLHIASNYIGKRWRGDAALLIIVNGRWRILQLCAASTGPAVGDRPQRTYIYQRWNRVSVSAHSAWAYTATLLVMVNVVKGGWACTPPHQTGLILPSWWNVRQKATVATLCTLGDRPPLSNGRLRLWSGAEGWWAAGGISLYPIG